MLIWDKQPPEDNSIMLRDSKLDQWENPQTFKLFRLKLQGYNKYNLVLMRNTYFY